MITVGITGGIGSGKTTVCREWEKLGAYVLYADDLAKELMNTDPGIREEIIEAFGPQSYHEDGTLNRAHLTGEAFHKGRVKELNAIVHPRVYDATRRLKKQAEADGHKIFVKEAALLLQNGRPENLDCLVLVLADRAKRVKRVMERDRADEHLVQNKMQKQQDFEELRHLADYILENNGTLNELRNKARSLYSKLEKSA